VIHHRGHRERRCERDERMPSRGSRKSVSIGVNLRMAVLGSHSAKPKILYRLSVSSVRSVVVNWAAREVWFSRDSRCTSEP
jgi:hypothetical protein